MLPKVTVLMPVYNGAQHLSEAMDSILNQTYKNYEFLIINDGSNDQSQDIIRAYTDPRIHLVNHELNQGIVSTLNEGLELATGDYIVRMDCDDISLPERLAKQVAYMESHKEVAVCGTWAKVIGNGKSQIWKLPNHVKVIKCGLLFNSNIIHSSAILRSKVFKNANLNYDSFFLHAEDYELWIRTSRKYNLSNLPQILIHYRLHSQQISQRYNKAQLSSAKRIRLDQLVGLGLHPSEIELELHETFWVQNYNATKDFVGRVESWLLKLKKANAATLIYDETAFAEVLGNYWKDVCRTAMSAGFWPVKTYIASPLRYKSKIKSKDKFVEATNWLVVYFKGVIYRNQTTRYLVRIVKKFLRKT